MLATLALAALLGQPPAERILYSKPLANGLTLFVRAAPGGRAGVYLSRGGQVWELAAFKNDYELIEVARAGQRSIVLDRRGNYGIRSPLLKLFFDPDSKRLLKRVEFAAVFVPALFPPYAVASTGKELLALKGGAIVTGPEADSVLARVPNLTADGRPLLSPFDPPRIKLPPLPQSTYDAFARARPQRVRDGYVRKGTEIVEKVGPAEREAGRLWFGKIFYDGEGTTGVGGFGWYDGAYHLISKPELADWSVSAIRVAPDAVWLGLVRFPEGAPFCGGLVRYDRASGDVRKYSFDEIIYCIRVVNGAVWLGTANGLAVLREGRFIRYTIEPALDGKWSVVVG